MSMHDEMLSKCPPQNGEATYCLEVYPKLNAREVIASFYSDEPFQSFHAGDYFHDTFMREGGGPGDPAIRIARVEHLVWPRKGTNRMRHKVMIYLNPNEKA